METQKKRIDYLDLAKGIGILLVVWAHARGPYSSYMYQMHMPFFFIISGLLYSSSKPLKQFIKGKITSLYIPFVFWNCMFITIKSYIHGVNIKTILNMDFKVLLTIEKDGQFLGATWFLGALFLVSIIYKLLDTYIKNSKFKPFVMLSLSVIAGITGFTITFDHMLSRVLVLSMFFGFGVFVKTYIGDFKSVDCCALAIVSALIFLIIGKYNSANMGANQYRYPLLFVVGAVGASYALLYFCRWIDKLCQNIHVLEYIKNIGTFFGRNSLDILIWQFVAFRFVILLQMYKWHNPITWDELLSHYPVYVVSNGWWIVYTIVGMVVPVLFCSLLRAKPLGYITRKIHIV